MRIVRGCSHPDACRQPIERDEEFPALPLRSVCEACGTVFIEQRQGVIERARGDAGPVRVRFE